MTISSKHILTPALLAALIAGVAGCSDDMPRPGLAGSAPEFEVSADRGQISPSGGLTDTAGTVTTENIRDFSISAYAENDYSGLLMNNVDVTRVGPNSWRYPKPVKWPDNDVVHFYAVSPATVDIVMNRYWHNIIAWRPGEAANTDLVVAVRRDATKSEGRVRLNFRHTMARVQVSVAADVPGTRVRLKQIDLYWINSNSVFYMPQESTSDRNVTGQLDDCWTSIRDHDPGTAIIPYHIAEEGEEITLSPTPALTGNQGNYFFIPCPFSPLHNAGGWISGSSIRLLCRFEDAATGEVTWPDNSTSNMLIPGWPQQGWGYVFISLYDAQEPRMWRPGLSYNYTVTIRRPGEVPPALNGARCGPEKGNPAGECRVSVAPY